jgi:succinate dehydrogenase / fumarate reductase, iron-sulfur subunit
MQAALEICRFNPETDTVPWFQKISVDVEEHQTVLDALLLAWQQDQSLSFRRSCRSAICGSCAIRINGRPALACQTLIRNAVSAAGPMVLEPLPHFRQLKDLVVDLDPLFDSLKAVVPWLILKDDYNGRMEPGVVRAIENPATCILCGICQADLDGVSDVKPAGVVKAMRFSLDPRDAMGMHRIRLLQLPPEVLKLFIRQLPRNCPKNIEVSEDVVQVLGD